MKIKVKCIETGAESEFDTDGYHISVQMSPDELGYIKSMEDTEGGLSPTGSTHRTAGFLRPVDDAEYDALSVWAKQ